MIRKNGAGDLVKGEKCVFLTFQSFLYAHCYSRYCSVDFIVFSTIAFVFLLRIVLTYDIICQWSKNFRTRMEEYPEYMQIPDTTRVDVAIPGWHINGHGDTCQNKFNLSYMEGVGRTVGEDIETTWAGTNPLASSVREMGPAARHDTLNDHWNGWNFRKIVGFRTFSLSFYIHLFLIISFIGTLFMKRFHEAHKMSAIQTDVFNQLSATFSTDTVRKWEKMSLRGTLTQRPQIRTRNRRAVSLSLSFISFSCLTLYQKQPFKMYGFSLRKKMPLRLPLVSFRDIKSLYRHC